MEHIYGVGSFASKTQSIIIKPRKLHLLRIEIADFLRNVDNGSKRGVVAFLLPLHIRASSAADLDG